jgi:hypothetical protein
MTCQIPKKFLNLTRQLAKVSQRSTLLFIAGLLITGCLSGSQPSVSSSPTPGIAPQGNTAGTAQASAAQASAAQPTLSQLLAIPTQPPYRVWLPPYLPENMRSLISLPQGYTLTSSSQNADLTLTVDDQNLLPNIQWIYALVAPFPTIADGISLDDLQAAWLGNATGPFANTPLLMDSGTLDVLSIVWGAPAESAVQVLPADQLLEVAWSSQPSWAIIPFESLEPRWKVLTINGQSPIHKDFDPTHYALNIPFVMSGVVSVPTDNLTLPSTNRDASRLTTVAMTGVTAMVRATASTMEQEGYTYPAGDIGSLLTQADITHISNEIPFSPNCPFPSPTMPNLVFCSNPAYIALLKAVGTDVMELTGDHFMDYGADATLYTLQMYKDLGWPYYGGGADAEDARQPVLLENNGNKIAFMGCNVGCEVKNEIPCDAIATDDHPGASQCDFEALSSEIASLRDQEYSVIFTFQHREYYTYTTEPILANDFGLVAKAGATIVSGSQAHQPHGFSFESGAFIHYGLGNLFFDQYHYCVDYACDDAFIDRHVFYDGHYISTELITIRFIDFARPRLMTPEERAHFLDIIFKASAW